MLVLVSFRTMNGLNHIHLIILVYHRCLEYCALGEIGIQEFDNDSLLESVPLDARVERYCETHLLDGCWVIVDCLWIDD